MVPAETDVFGGNMAVRSRLLDTGLRFNTRLMLGSQGLMSEDVDLLVRAVRSGARVAFIPGARVFHLVASQQVTWRSILGRFCRHGHANLFLEVVREREHAGRPPPAMLAGVPRYLLRRLATHVAGLPLAAARCDIFYLFSQLHLIAYDAGAIRQARRMAQQGARGTAAPGAD